MAIIQVAYKVPKDIHDGLLSGNLKRFGSVVRDHTGIIKHLKEVPISAQNQKPDISVHIAKILKKNKTPIIIGLSAAVAAGVAFFAMKSNKKSKESAIVENYNASLCAYLEAVRSGNVNIDIINRLASNLENIKTNYNSEGVKINFSPRQLEILVNLVFDYTRKLAEANSIELSGLEKRTSTSSDNTILNFQRYLEVQKQIFEKAS